MTNWLEVNDWLDLVANAWIGLVVVSAAAVPSFLAARNHKSIAAIRDNVQNGHTTPMRQDLDKALAAIEALAHDINGLRQDLAVEETRRRSQISDIAGDLDRIRRRP